MDILAVLFSSLVMSTIKHSVARKNKRLPPVISSRHSNKRNSTYNGKMVYKQNSTNLVSFPIPLVDETRQSWQDRQCWEWGVWGEEWWWRVSCHRYHWVDQQAGWTPAWGYLAGRHWRTERIENNLKCSISCTSNINMAWKHDITKGPTLMTKKFW